MSFVMQLAEDPCNLLEATMVRKMSDSESVDIDPESYEEIRSISLGSEQDFLELDT